MYKAETKKILSGSLNLLPPTDQPDEIDAIAMNNWRVDTAGNLRSRLGLAAVYSVTGSVNSISKGISHDYAGSGTIVNRDGSSIDTSYDGNPVGFAAFKKYEWIMNKSKQRKDTGAAVSNWTITAPAAAPTTALKTESSSTVEGFESAANYTASTGLTLADDGADKKSGTNSMLCTFTAPGDFTATRTGLTLNLNSVGGQSPSDDDKCRIWIKVTEPKAVQAIYLYVDVSAGTTFDTDYYQVRIPKRKWKHARGAWVQLEIRRTQTINDVLTTSPATVDALRDVINPRLTERETIDFSDQSASVQTLISQNALSFERVGATAGRDWSTVTGLKVQIEGVGEAGTTVRFDLWDIFGSAVGAVEGRDVQHYYTYVNTDGHESNPSPVSVALSANRRGVDVTVAASADAQVTGIHIYRTGGTLGAVYRVTSSAEANTNHTYADTKTDETLTSLNVKLAIDNDPPPAAAGLAGPFFGRLIAFNTTANPARFFWSKKDAPWAFPGAANTTTGNWADIGDTGYAILAATNNGLSMLLYKNDSIWRLIGDPGDSDGRCDKLPSQVGLAGVNAICSGPDGDYFLGPDGVYFLANHGDIPRKISTKIDPIFKGQATTLFTGTSIAAMTTTVANRATSAMMYWNGNVFLSYPETGQSSPNITLRYDVASERWTQDSRAFTAFYNKAGIPIGGTSGGLIRQMETTTQDAGSAYAITYQSRYDDQGAPDTQKTFEDLVIEADTGGATLTVAAYTNNGATTLTVTPSTFSTSAKTKTIFQFDTAGLGAQGYNLSVRISGNTNNADVVLYGAWIHFYAEARTANSFDSDETDFGMKGVKLIRSVELDIVNAGATASLQVFTDLPGNAQASRETISIAAGTTRRVVPKMLASQYKAYLGRFVLDGTGYKLHGFRAEVKAVGDYVIANEVWDSDELDFDTERVKLIKEIEIDFDSTATLSMVYRTDLPSGVISTRATKTIAVSSGREVRKVRLEGTYKGRLHVVRLSSSVDWILYGVRAFVKMVGEPNATPWHFVELPVEKTSSNSWQFVNIPIDAIA